MRKPIDTDSLIDAAASQPALGAQLYAASLLAIEVDTPEERTYMKRLAERLGLNPDTVAVLEQAIGMQRT